MVGAIEIAALGRGLGKHDAVLPGGPAFQYGFKLRLAPPDDDHVACTACHVQHVDVDAAHRLAQPIDRMCRVIVRSDQPGFLRRHCKEYRSEEHTSELQSLMRNSYADFCLK